MLWHSAHFNVNFAAFHVLKNAAPAIEDVDADTCQRPLDLSDSEPGSASAGLSYSYETCGNLNTYSETRHLKYLRGKHLRVSYPGDSGSGYSELYECSSCLFILLC